MLVQFWMAHGFTSFQTGKDTKVEAMRLSVNWYGHLFYKILLISMLMPPVIIPLEVVVFGFVVRCMISYMTLHNLLLQMSSLHCLEVTNSRKFQKRPVISYYPSIGYDNGLQWVVKVEVGQCNTWIMKQMLISYLHQYHIWII